MSWLGNLLVKGSNKVVNLVPVNLQRYVAEAESGVANAQFALGCFYEQAQHGLVQDFAAAARWYREAGVQGHNGAQLYLGLLLVQGKGVDQDVIEAYKWIELAKGGSALDRVAATETLGRLSKCMTSEQIAEGKRLSVEFIPTRSRDFLSKPSRQWRIYFLNPEGTRALSVQDVQAFSQPQDRSGAVAAVWLLWEAGAKLDRVTYGGRPISRVQLENLVADGHLLMSLRLAGEKRGIPFETFVTTEPDKAIVKAVIQEVIQRAAKTLAITEECAADILVMRRLPVGIGAICKQQTP